MRPTYRGFRGDLLRKKREEKGWTQHDLAVHMGVFPTMVGKWERAEVVPDSRNISRLAQQLGARPQDFTDVPLAEASLTDLRVWAGLTRDDAAVVAGIARKRLFHLEHLTQTPRPEEAAALAKAYGVEAADVLAAWERDRARAYPDVPAARGA